MTDDRSPTELLVPLLQLLDLDEVESDVFRHANPQWWPGERVFGGQVAAQALRAALRTVPDDRGVHSLHAYFLLGGKPGVPIDYRIERVRDGRSFTTRVVKAVQDGAVIFDMSASFHITEDGPTYQLPMLDVPGPDSDQTYDPGFGRWVRRKLPFEFRELGPTEPSDGVWSSTRRVWMRTPQPLPDDPAVHACLLAFVSDMGMVFAARAPFEDTGWERIMGASLDHAMWFHRPIRMDDWVYYDQWAVANAGARGLAQGLMYGADGTLGVSIAQEALMRFVRPDKAQQAGPGDDEPKAETS